MPNKLEEHVRIHKILNVGSGSGSGGAGYNELQDINGIVQASTDVAAPLRIVGADGVGITIAELGPDRLTIDGSALLPLDGSRAMTSNLDMGSNNIINVGTVDGIDLSNHVSDTTIHFTKSSILLDNLGDVDLTGLTSNDLLQWNGSSWIAIDPTIVGVTDHGNLAGLADDDHLQYHTDARAATWLTTQSHTVLQDIGVNTHGQIDTFIAGVSGVADQVAVFNSQQGIGGDNALRWLNNANLQINAGGYFRATNIADGNSAYSIIGSSGSQMDWHYYANLAGVSDVFSYRIAGAPTAGAIAWRWFDNDPIMVLNQTGLLIGANDAAVNELDIDGSAVIGTSYAGVTTAPTNGLLVEGNVAIGKTSASVALDVSGGILTSGDIETATSFRAGTGLSIESFSGTQRHVLKYGSEGNLNDSDLLMLTNREVNGEIAIATDNGTGGAAGETERIRILSGSDLRIGIGTNTPTQNVHLKEDIAGTINVEIENTNTGTGSSAAVTVKTTSGSVTGRLRSFSPNSTAVIDGFALADTVHLIGYGANGMHFWNRDGSSGVGKPFHWFNNISGADHHLMTLDANGQLGIGTSTPEAGIQIANGGIRVQDEVNTSTGAGLEIEYKPSIGRSEILSYDRDVGDFQQIYIRGNDLRFQSSSTEVDALRILPSGNSGFGTATPNERLTVEGVISLLEQSSAPSFTASYGKVYVKTDNNLYYLDDSANEQLLNLNETDISHLNIQDIGSNTHAQIDTFISGISGTSGEVAFFTSSQGISSDSRFLFNNTNARIDLEADTIPLVLGNNNTATNTHISVLNLNARTSSDMVDGFGARIALLTEDSAAIERENVQLYSERDGGDQQFSFVIATDNSGISEKFRVKPTGEIYLNEHTSSPATPTTGFATIYPKTDGLLYFKNDTGVEYDLTEVSSVGGTDGQFQYNNSGDLEGSPNLTYDDINNRVGIGTTSPESILHISDPTTMIAEVSGIATSTDENGLILRHTTSNSAADGFGIGLEFQIEDSAALSNTIGSIKAIRENGSDLTGRLELISYNSGSPNTGIAIAGDGKVGIGLTDPEGKLHVQGSVATLLDLKNGDTTTVANSVVLRHTSTGTPADGFGTGIRFEIEEDIVNIPNLLAEIRAVRDGGDTTGRLEFRTFDAGSPSTSMKIEPTGELTLLELSSGTTPSSGYGAIYPKTDGNLYFLDDLGTEYQLNQTDNVTASPTPSDNQIAVWVDADTIEGTDGITWDAGVLTVTGVYESTRDGNNQFRHPNGTGGFNTFLGMFVPFPSGDNKAELIMKAERQLTLESGNSYSMFIRPTGTNGGLKIDPNGRVTVLGQAGTNGYRLRFKAGSAQTTPVTLWEDSSDNILSYVGPIGEFAAPSGVATTPGWSFLGDLDTGAYNPNPDELGLVAGGVESLRVTVSGLEPPIDNTYDLGSPSLAFRELYISGGSIDMDGSRISIQGDNFNFGKSLRSTGVISVLEQGSAPSTTIDYGKYYAKTDGKPYFLSDSGVEYDLSVGAASAAGADTQIQFNSGGSFAGSADLTWDGSVLNVGQRVIIQTQGSGNIIDRASSDTNLSRGALNIRHTTSGDMVDGFGIHQHFQIVDSAAITQNVGKIRVERSGADNSGKMIISTFNAGTEVDSIFIAPDGKVKVGSDISSVSVPLTVDGAIRANRAGVTSQYINIDGGNAGGSFITASSAISKSLIINNENTDSSASDFIFQHNGNNIVRFKGSNGNVGIGNTSPNIRLVVEDGVNGYVGLFNNTNNTTSAFGVVVRAGLDSPTTTGDIRWMAFQDGNGTNESQIRFTTATVGAEFAAISDVRLKTNIRDTEENGLDLINSIQLRAFDWIDGKKPSQKIGYIAQELEQVAPFMVSKSRNEDDTDDEYFVGDSGLIPYLVKAIQEQQEQIEELKEEVKLLKTSK